MKRRPLTIDEILRCADLYRETTGRWPTLRTGLVIGMLGETWLGIDRALHQGLRGLPGGSSLAQLLAEKRNARHMGQRPPLTPEKILAWIDAHHASLGVWPTSSSGFIPNSGGETWTTIEIALRNGLRGLPGGSSLAQFLAEQRGVRNRKALPPLNEEEILTWAEAHQRRTGDWPNFKSGPIPEAPGETWGAVNAALSRGNRGLPGGSTLARLLAERRDIRNFWSLPDLTLEQIRAWIDAHWSRTNTLPTAKSGPIPEAPAETWSAIDHALRSGKRGLPGGSSLAQLLQAERGYRHTRAVPPLSRKQIVAWAKAHHRQSGQWPTRESGSIPDSNGETWSGVDSALKRGIRGLRGGSSLARLLARHVQRRHIHELPPLTKKQILVWADAHFARTGAWPNQRSGPVLEAPQETWGGINAALLSGYRGQPGGSSLRKLLARARGVRYQRRLPPLTAEQIARWAELHFQRTGTWPRHLSGPIAEVPGETWCMVNYALRFGTRGLPGGSSLARFLAEKLGVGGRARTHQE